MYFLYGRPDYFFCIIATHFYSICFFGVICFQDFLAKSIEVHILGFTEGINHGKVILAEALMYKIRVKLLLS